MKIHYEFVKRDIAGESFLVPIGEAAKKFSGLFALNELGEFLWKNIPGAADEAELVERVLGEYEVGRDEAEKDTAAFMDKLREMEIVD